MFNYTPVTLKFEGVKTIGEMYELHIKDLRQTVMALDTKEKLQEAKLELMELIAYVEEKKCLLRQNMGVSYIGGDYQTCL